MDGTIPIWLIGLFPVINFGVTELVKRVPALAAFGGKNISAIIALVLAGALIATGQIPSPVEWPAYGGDVMVYVLALGGVFGYAWKVANAIYDGLKAAQAPG